MSARRASWFRAKFAAGEVAMPKAKPKSPPAEAPAPEPEILQRLETPSRWNMALVAGGLVLAAGLSALAVRGAMKKGKGEG